MSPRMVSSVLPLSRIVSASSRCSGVSPLASSSCARQGGGQAGARGKVGAARKVQAEGQPGGCKCSSLQGMCTSGAGPATRPAAMRRCAHRCTKHAGEGPHLRDRNHAIERRADLVAHCKSRGGVQGSDSEGRRWAVGGRPAFPARGRDASPAGTQHCALLKPQLKAHAVGSLLARNIDLASAAISAATLASCSTAQHSTAWLSTAQHSAAQHGSGANARQRKGGGAELFDRRAATRAAPLRSRQAPATLHPAA